MIKRTIEISQASAHLAVKLDQLLIRRRDGEKRIDTSIPCEDIGLIVVDQPAVTYSHGALGRLMEHGAVVVVCGRDHLPAGLLLPMATHSEGVWRIHDQIAARKPLKKQLWKQIVAAKIRAQAANLDPGSAPQRKLRNLARTVRSGDPSNVEAQAARVYWSAWLGKLPSAESFRRDPDGDGINALLNYGYAILRAAVARALIAGGLHPALGLHHANRANAFCLADDLLEPLRPLVDARVRSLHREGQNDLDQPTKAALLKLLTTPVQVGDQIGPLMVRLHRTVASLVRCFAGTDKQLLLPIAAEGSS